MRLALAFAVLPALPATAAMQPCYFDLMVAEALRVMQIAEHDAEGPDSSGSYTLTGTVLRGFRGDIASGSLVQTSFACANPNGSVGPTIFHDAAAVARAGAVELHNALDGGPAGHGWGLLPLEAPTDASVFVFEHLREGGC